MKVLEKGIIGSKKRIIYLGLVIVHLFPYLVRVGYDKGHQCVHRDHPGGDGGAKVLGKKGTQGNILPFLTRDVEGEGGRGKREEEREEERLGSKHRYIQCFSFSK